MIISLSGIDCAGKAHSLIALSRHFVSAATLFAVCGFAYFSLMDSSVRPSGRRPGVFRVLRASGSDARLLPTGASQAWVAMAVVDTLRCRPCALAQHRGRPFYVTASLKMPHRPQPALSELVEPRGRLEGARGACRQTWPFTFAFTEGSRVGRLSS